MQPVQTRVNPHSALPKFVSIPMEQIKPAQPRTRAEKPDAVEFGASNSRGNRGGSVLGKLFERVMPPEWKTHINTFLAAWLAGWKLAPVVVKPATTAPQRRPERVRSWYA